MGQEARHKINIVNEVHHLLRHERYVYVFIAVTAGLLLLFLLAVLQFGLDIKDFAMNEKAIDEVVNFLSMFSSEGSLSLGIGTLDEVIDVLKLFGSEGALAMTNANPDEQAFIIGLVGCGGPLAFAFGRLLKLEAREAELIQSKI